MAFFGDNFVTARFVAEKCDRAALSSNDGITAQK